MPLYQNRIIVTGGTGRFAQVLKKVKTKYSVFFPTKLQLNIMKEASIQKYLRKKKPKYLIHLAGLSRPMSVHENDIKKSIDLNIIGTANIVKACEKLRIKLIYFSSSYVYPGKKGNYKDLRDIRKIERKMSKPFKKTPIETRRESSNTVSDTALPLDFSLPKFKKNFTPEDDTLKRIEEDRNKVDPDFFRGLGTFFIKR